MSVDAKVTLVVLGNSIIAFAYIAIALFIAPKFRMATTTNMVRFIQGVVLLFFTLCALSHIDIAYHAITERPGWLFSPHFIVQHFVQGAAGFTFLVLAQRYLTIRIFRQNDEYDEVVRHFVEERLEEVANRIQKDGPKG